MLSLLQMKLAFTIFLLSISLPNWAQIENDKVLHFVGGNLFGLAGAGIAKEISDGNRFWTFAGALGGSALVGLGKEAIDSNPNGSGWDNGDLMATILGGATIGVTIDLFTDHSKRKKTRPQGGLTVEAVPIIEVFSNTDYRLPSLSEFALPPNLLE